MSPNERWVEWREGEDSVWSTDCEFDYTRDVPVRNPTSVLIVIDNCESLPGFKVEFNGLCIAAQFRIDVSGRHFRG